MTPGLELLAAFIGSIAALASALFVFYKWAVDQENAKNEQLRREIKSEIRAEIYRELLRLNVQWLSSNDSQRQTINRLSGELDDDSEDMLEQVNDQETSQSR